jgi:hypothetical protein
MREALHCGAREPRAEFTGLRRAVRFLPLCLLVLLLPAGRAAGAATNIYFTGFEKAEGYDDRYELAGQRSWLKDPSGGGGNGLVTNFFGTWAGYVGLFSLNPKAEFLSVWRPINFSPPNTNRFEVRFSVMMAVFDSLDSTNRDNFFWSVYNQQANRLFTLDFDNNDLGIYYLLDGSSGWVDTGWSFANDLAYDLEIVMNFSSNRWSALLGGETIIANQPITTTNAPRNLGDVDAVWAITDINRAGDNFMAFDDYRITGELLPVPPPASPVLGPFGRQPNGSFVLRVNGANGTRFAVDGSTNFTTWTALGTNTISGGFFDYTDTNSVLNRRFYRARWVP